MEQGDRREVKKFLGDEHGEVEWGGVNFKTNKFLNGLWGRILEEILGGRFWSVFGSGGEEWCVGTEMM